MPTWLIIYLTGAAVAFGLTFLLDLPEKTVPNRMFDAALWPLYLILKLLYGRVR